MSKPVHTEIRDGFTIKLYLEEEYEQPDWDFESEEDRADVLRRIESGDLLWFCAKVSASKSGIELGTDYLGGCCYESVEQFIALDGYYPDMVNQALAEARANLIRPNADTQ